MQILFNHKFLIARRIIQLTILLLFFGANYFGWNILKGNFSSALFLDTIPISDPYAVLQNLSASLVITSDLLIGALIVLILYSLIFGRIFCSWICPVNIITDFATWLNNKLALKNHINFNRNARYYVFVLGIILSPILGYAAFEAISPIGIMHRGIIFGFGSAWTIILAIFLFDLAIMKHSWCGHICPLGAFYSLTGKISILKVKHSKNKCTSCMKCFNVCHEVQVLDIISKKDGVIKSGECTNCARCIEVCADKALKFSIRNPIKR